MPKETDVTGTPTTPSTPAAPSTPSISSSQGIQVIKANYVEVPISIGPATEDPQSAQDLLEIRSAFFSGKQLAPDQLAKLVKSAEGGGGNTNCNFC